MFQVSHSNLKILNLMACCSDVDTNRLTELFNRLTLLQEGIEKKFPDIKLNESYCISDDDNEDEIIERRDISSVEQSPLRPEGLPMKPHPTKLDKTRLFRKELESFEEFLTNIEHESHGLMENSTTQPNLPTTIDEIDSELTKTQVCNIY